MTPEAATDQKLGVKMQTWGSLPVQEFPKVPKEGVMNDHESHKKSKIGGHFWKMCTYDSMSPSSTTPARTLPTFGLGLGLGLGLELELGI